MRGREKIVVNSETLAMMMVDYEEGMTLKQVGSKYGMSANTARRLVEEGGCEIRMGTWDNSKRKPKCSCGHTNPMGSRYCNLCGKSLKAEEEKTIDGLLNARATLIQYAPDGIRKDMDSLIMKAVKLLKTKCGVE